MDSNNLRTALTAVVQGPHNVLTALKTIQDWYDVSTNPDPYHEICAPNHQIVKKLDSLFCGEDESKSSNSATRPVLNYEAIVSHMRLSDPESSGAKFDKFSNSPLELGLRRAQVAFWYLKRLHGRAIRHLREVEGWVEVERRAELMELIKSQNLDPAAFEGAGCTAWKRVKSKTASTTDLTDSSSTSMTTKVSSASKGKSSSHNIKDTVQVEVKPIIDLRKRDGDHGVGNIVIQSVNQNLSNAEPENLTTNAESETSDSDWQFHLLLSLKMLMTPGITYNCYNNDNTSNAAAKKNLKSWVWPVRVLKLTSSYAICDFLEQDPDCGDCGDESSESKSGSKKSKTSSKGFKSLKKNSKESATQQNGGPSSNSFGCGLFRKLIDLSGGSQWRGLDSDDSESTHSEVGNSESDSDSENSESGSQILSCMDLHRLPGESFNDCWSTATLVGLGCFAVKNRIEELVNHDDFDNSESTSSLLETSDSDLDYKVRILLPPLLSKNSVLLAACLGRHFAQLGRNFGGESDSDSKTVEHDIVELYCLDESESGATNDNSESKMMINNLVKHFGIRVCEKVDLSALRVNNYGSESQSSTTDSEVHCQPVSESNIYALHQPSKNATTYCGPGSVPELNFVECQNSLSGAQSQPTCDINDVCRTLPVRIVRKDEIKGGDMKFDLVIGSEDSKACNTTKSDSYSPSDLLHKTHGVYLSQARVSENSVGGLKEKILKRVSSEPNGKSKRTYSQRQTQCHVFQEFSLRANNEDTKESESESKSANNKVDKLILAEDTIILTPVSPDYPEIDQTSWDDLFLNSPGIDVGRIKFLKQKARSRKLKNAKQKNHMRQAAVAAVAESLDSGFRTPKKDLGKTEKIQSPQTRETVDDERVKTDNDSGTDSDSDSSEAPLGRRLAVECKPSSSTQTQNMIITPTSRSMPLQQAQKTEAVKIPKFLTDSEIKEIRALGTEAAATLFSKNIESDSDTTTNSMTEFSKPISHETRSHDASKAWKVLFLNENSLFQRRLPHIADKIKDLVIGLDEEHKWGLNLRANSDDGLGVSGCNMRVIEYHRHVAPSPGLPDIRHYDMDSLVTFDVLLNDFVTPGDDQEDGKQLPTGEFDGGEFQTLESDGFLKNHCREFTTQRKCPKTGGITSPDHPVEGSGKKTLSKGDAIVFVSHKYHCVSPVTRGERHVLVIEFWRYPDRFCGHRCELLSFDRICVRDAWSKQVMMRRKVEEARARKGAIQNQIEDVKTSKAIIEDVTETVKTVENTRSEEVAAEAVAVKSEVQATVLEKTRNEKRAELLQKTKRAAEALGLHSQDGCTFEKTEDGVSLSLINLNDSRQCSEANFDDAPEMETAETIVELPPLPMLLGDVFQLTVTEGDSDEQNLNFKASRLLWQSYEARHEQTGVDLAKIDFCGEEEDAWDDFD